MNVLPVVVGQSTSPSRMMHKRKICGRGLGVRDADRLRGWAQLPLPAQARAYVSQCEETTFAAARGPGSHPFSIIVTAPIVTECATPGAIWTVSSQCPSQDTGALNDVIPPPGMLHAVVLTVSVDGRSHDPVGGSHVHASHAFGATRSACPRSRWLSVRTGTPAPASPGRTRATSAPPTGPARGCTRPRHTPRRRLHPLHLDDGRDRAFHPGRGDHGQGCRTCTRRSRIQRRIQRGRAAHRATASAPSRHKSYTAWAERST